MRSLLHGLFFLLLPTFVLAGTAHETPLHERTQQVLASISEADFQQSIYIRSEEQESGASGSIYALVERPFSELSSLLDTPDAWCEITIMHMNVKGCVMDKNQQPPIIRMFSGRMHYVPLNQADRHDYILEETILDENYFRASIHGPEGPFGTRDYRIVIEVVAVDEERSLIHLGYSLDYTSLTRWVQRVYFATAGRHRLGFSRADEDSEELIRGLRGMIERNTVRFYLALQTWLELPEANKSKQRFTRWHELTEQHPDQLREQDLQTYLEIKQREYANQRRAQREL